MSEREDAIARVREGLAAKEAHHDPEDGPYTLGCLYETEVGTGRVLWKIDLNDVRLIVEAGQ